MEGKKVFRTAINGYNKSDVNLFIDQLSEKFKAENDELQEKISFLELKILEQSKVISEKQKTIEENNGNADENAKEFELLNHLLYGQNEEKPSKQPNTEAGAKPAYELNTDSKNIVEMAEQEAKIIKKQLQIKLLSTENSYYETKYKLRNLTEKIDKDINEINKSLKDFKDNIDNFTITEILHNKYELEEEKLHYDQD